MTLSIALLHEKPQFLKECCELLNEEWQRSESARMRTFENSCNNLPTNIILLENELLIGHLKLSRIPSIIEGCFIESVVIKKQLRGRGYGTKIMKMAEDYCKYFLNLKKIYLSTKDQVKFYSKLGYEECPPISIYGCHSNLIGNSRLYSDKMESGSYSNAKQSGKTYMTKLL